MNQQLENPQINEHLWQKWIWKNKELDKAGDRKRLRFLQVLLVVSIGAAVAQNFMK